nr:response regulator [uncultured Pseudomonas sp.]
MDNRNNGAVSGARRRSILLVEDDDVLRTLTAELMTEMDYQVFEVEDAPAALAILRSARPLDLLMTDIGLPGMSGDQLMVIAQQLRPELPGLFASGYGDGFEPMVSDAVDAPRVAVIQKPYSPELLRTTLRTLFEQP